jgi:hypothetical protein
MVTTCVTTFAASLRPSKHSVCERTYKDTFGFPKKPDQERKACCVEGRLAQFVIEPETLLRFREVHALIPPPTIIGHELTLQYDKINRIV